MPTVHGPPSRMKSTRSPSAVAHVIGGGGRDLREAVGAGRGDGNLRGRDECQRNGMSRHAHAHRRQARGNDFGDRGSLGQDQRERSGPEFFRQSLRNVGPGRSDGCAPCLDR